MLVYVVMKLEDYGESTIVGVYSTPELAGAHIDDAYEKKPEGNYTTHWDYWCWEVQ